MVVEVRDTGPGLNPANLDHLFHSFYTTKPHGMGMGLAISRSIIEAHCGRVWAAPCFSSRSRSPHRRPKTGNYRIHGST
ncbi:MAG: hypothetical protein JO122_17230 [Acetobacteraceae bacterium]|nr:hypothetical protein [Acetobacteraceae bacterium]